MRGIHTLDNYVMGTDAVAIGTRTMASGDDSFAQGNNTTASALNAHAEGSSTISSGTSSHAEGSITTASAISAHAEGVLTNSSGSSSHAEGTQTVASGNYAHAEGLLAHASGTSAHAEGTSSTASGNYSHAANYLTIAQNYAQTAIGKANVASDLSLSQTALDDAFIIGNGVVNARSNAFRVQFNGDAHSASGVYTTGADYAEMFEWQDQNPEKEDRRGFFVTLDNEYIRKATATDSYILGVISSSPSVVGNTHGCIWQGMYMRDEWGDIIYEWADVQQEISESNPRSGDIHTRTETYRVERPKLNPEYDTSHTYLPRTKRSEWAVVGLMGRLIVRDDGSCKPNGYCWANPQGIGTSSKEGYRVLKRINTNKVLICLK